MFFICQTAGNLVSLFRYAVASERCASPSLLFSLCSFLSCQVKSRCLMEALCHVIGRSVRHSAPGTLRALIRSLGLLTSQGWMLQQNTDQMTAPRFAQTCKGGGSGKRKSICFASLEAFFLHLFGASASFLLTSRVQLRASLFICGVKCQRGA